MGFHGSRIGLPRGFHLCRPALLHGVGPLRSRRGMPSSSIENHGKLVKLVNAANRSEDS
jgi:hypothetical protein